MLNSLRKQSDGIYPDILWSDEDLAIPSAIENTYGENKITHLLCDWHIRKIVIKKLHSNNEE